MTENGYKKCQSDNIARVDSFMIAKYFSTSDSFLRAEMRGVKAARSCRDSYGDSAVGYVQVKRAKHLCFMKGTVCPEHRVKHKGYAVSLIVNEKERAIVSVQCFDCAASKGGCKHAIAFLTWVHRRSEEPAPTEVICYWKKSKLSRVGTSIKFVEAKDFGNSREPPNHVSDGSFLQEFVQQAGSSSSQLLKHCKKLDPIQSLSMDQLLYDYIDQGGNLKNVDEFVTFCSNELLSADLESASRRTLEQSESSLWFHLRYARITASKLYEASRCKKEDGSLVEVLLGAKKFKSTQAMLRGVHLESKVKKAVEKLVGKKLEKVGLLLNNKYPMLGASPDAVSSDCVFEIKCPSSAKTVLNYVKNQKVHPKYLAQMHLQMLFSNKTEALFCVASPDFEKTEEVTLYPVHYDEKFANEVISNAVSFWVRNVFPILVKGVE